jgi:hypothetical protein
METKKNHLGSQIIHKACWEISLTIVHFTRLLGGDELHFPGRGIHAICRYFKQKSIFQIIIINYRALSNRSTISAKAENLLNYVYSFHICW